MTNEPVTWTPERLPLSALLPKRWKQNPRQSSKRTAEGLVQSRERFSQPFPILIDLNGDMIDGHQKADSWANEYGKDLVVNVARADRVFSEQDKQEFTLLFHQVAFGQWNLEELSNWDFPVIAEGGFDQELLKSLNQQQAFLIELFGDDKDDGTLNFDDPFAPTTDPEIELKAYTKEDMQKAADKLDDKFDFAERKLKSVMCPHCGEEFFVE